MEVRQELIYLYQTSGQLLFFPMFSHHTAALASGYKYVTG
jgi:hypothetical protein